MTLVASAGHFGRLLNNSTLRTPSARVLIEALFLKEIMDLLRHVLTLLINKSLEIKRSIMITRQYLHIFLVENHGFVVIKPCPPHGIF